MCHSAQVRHLVVEELLQHVSMPGINGRGFYFLFRYLLRSSFTSGQQYVVILLVRNLFVFSSYHKTHNYFFFTDDLTAFIAIKPDYPKVSSIFRIKFNGNLPAGEDLLRDIEREVNVMWEKPPTLSAQLQRLRSCFDIYLETESLAPREKIFFHPVRGRTRSRPYKYVELGGGIFTHR